MRGGVACVIPESSMDPLADSGQFIADVPAGLERQMARAARAMARLRTAHQRLNEEPGVPDALRKVAEAGATGAAAADSAIDRAVS